MILRNISRPAADLLRDAARAAGLLIFDRRSERTFAIDDRDAGALASAVADELTRRDRPSTTVRHLVTRWTAAETSSRFVPIDLLLAAHDRGALPGVFGASDGCTLAYTDDHDCAEAGACSSSTLRWLERTDRRRQTRRDGEELDDLEAHAGSTLTPADVLGERLVDELELEERRARFDAVVAQSAERALEAFDAFPQIDR